MRYALTLLVCLLAGCGKGVAPVAETPAEFRRYFERFDSYAQTRGDVRVTDRIAIEFGDVPSGAEAECISTNLRGRGIIVDEEIWAALDEPSREVLIFHELGHCALNRGHDSREDGGIRHSLMHPKRIEGHLFESAKAQYVAELFSETGTGIETESR